MKLNKILTISAVSSLLLVSAKASSLVGSSVDGQMLISGVAPNYFDPAVGYVDGPNGSFPGGSLNASGTTVTISATAVEFGYMDGANTISADFTGSDLTVTDVTAAGAGGETPITFVFTDTDFASLSKNSDTFADGGLSGSISGDVITLNFAGGNVTSPGSVSANFSIGTAGSSVPDASTTLGLFSVGLMSLAGLKRKFASV